MCLTKEEKQLVDRGNLTDEERERIRNGGCVKKFLSLFIDLNKYKKIELKKEIDSSKNNDGCYILRVFYLNDKYFYEYFNKKDVIELINIANEDRDIQTIKMKILNWIRYNKNNLMFNVFIYRDPEGLIYELIAILKEFKL